MISGGIGVAIWPATNQATYTGVGQARLALLGMFGRVGLVLLRGNDVLAKLGRFPRRDAAGVQAAKVWLGSQVKIGAIHAGGDPCRAAVSTTAQANRRMSAFGYQAEVLCSV
jgi:hypothetical protein